MIILCLLLVCMTDHNFPGSHSHIMLIVTHAPWNGKSICWAIRCFWVLSSLRWLQLHYQCKYSNRNVCLVHPSICFFYLHESFSCFDVFRQYMLCWKMLTSYGYSFHAWRESAALIWLQALRHRQGITKEQKRSEGTQIEADKPEVEVGRVSVCARGLSI